MRSVFPAVAPPSAPATNVFHDVLLAAALLLLEGHAGVVVGQSYSGKCPDGGLALTPDLYLKGYGAYQDAACIPNGAFCHLNDVTLTNLEQLMFVGEPAFLDFSCGSDTLVYVCVHGQCKRNFTGATFAECDAQT